MKLELTAQAERDVGLVFVDGCEKFGKTRADTYLTQLIRALDRLIELPFANRVMSEVDGTVRVHRFRAHIILYRIDGDRVRIIRVRHGREDWQDWEV